MTNDASGVDLEGFREWVARNSGVGTVKADLESPSPLVKMVALSQDQPAVSNGRLIGPGVPQALQADQNVRQARASGNQQAVENALAVSPATGCAMILTLAMQASGYNPAAPGQGGNVAGFTAYAQQVLTCPVFSVQLHDQQSPNMSGDWSSVVDQIASFYVGIGGADMDNIKSGLLSLAQAASSNPSTDQTDNLFVQNAINVGDQLLVYMYQSFVQMVTNVESGGKHSPDTVTNNASLTINRIVLQFNTAAWPAYMPVIMPQTSASLDDWLNDATTPQGPIPVNWGSGGLGTSANMANNNTLGGSGVTIPVGQQNVIAANFVVGTSGPGVTALVQLTFFDPAGNVVKQTQTACSYPAQLVQVVFDAPVEIDHTTAWAWWNQASLLILTFSYVG